MINLLAIKQPITSLSKKVFSNRLFNRNFSSNNCLKNFSFRNLNEQELDSFSLACQEFSDCYLVSSLEALSKSKKGREILSKNIEIAPKQDDGFCGLFGNIIKISFPNINGKKETFFVGAKEMDKNFDIYYHQKNKILFAVKMSMKKLIKKHFFKKPLISRLVPFTETFEYNKPSNFLEMFTGKKPIIIAESDVNFNLKKYKKDVFNLLKRMAQTKNSNYSFVVGTGISGFGNIKSWHCLVVDKVDDANKMITLKNKRGNGKYTFSFDELIATFKYIVGYFDENLR